MNEKKMEIISTPITKEDVDVVAERVFNESIKLLGGLRKLIEYRNLTWLPSLAEASYTVVLKEELFKTHYEIAEELGITEQTVKKILQADEELVEKYLKGELEKVDEHKAGGIAKLAYKKVKNEKGIFIKEEEMEVLGVEWAIKVLIRLKGVDFPVKKEDLEEKLKGIIIKGKPVEEILEKMEFPLKTPAEVLHQIKKNLS